MMIPADDGDNAHNTDDDDANDEDEDDVMMNNVVIPTCSSLPSVTSTTIRPLRFLPVLPMRCTSLIGEALASKHTIRSTSPISSPSSPTHVATRVLYPPSRNRWTT